MSYEPDEITAPFHDVDEATLTYQWQGMGDAEIVCLCGQATVYIADQLITACDTCGRCYKAWPIQVTDPGVAPQDET